MPLFSSQNFPTTKTYLLPTILACSPTPPLTPAKYETFSEKLYRKCSAQPLVPVGCVGTVVFLTLGLKSFRDGHAARSQKMMRGRVAAQGVTVAFIIGYALYDQSKTKVPDTPAEADRRILDGEARR